MKQRLSIALVETATEGFAVALIRNECRQWMTHDTTVLNVKRQIAFMKAFMKEVDTDRGYRLFLARLGGMPCGFGVIKLDGTRACLTGGLAKPFRGKGFGGQLFKYLIGWAQADGKKPWLEVLRTNRRAIRLYKSLGFREVRSTKRLLVMEYDAILAISNSVAASMADTLKANPMKQSPWLVLLKKQPFPANLGTAK